MDLTELYDLHERGELSSNDQRWMQVQQQLSDVVGAAVRRNARNLHGQTLDNAIIEVEGALLQKFVSKRFSPREGRPLNPLLQVVIRNELLSLFRRNKSPSTVGFDGAETVWEGNAMTVSTDLFGRVRNNLGEYRFPEHNHIREAILAYFLTKQKYPGPLFLQGFGVSVGKRRAVYNAAVVDLNCAMTDLCDAR